MTDLRETLLNLARAIDDALAAMPDDATEVPRRYMKVTAYAQRRGYSPRTIRSYIARGLPCEGEGRGRRIEVEKADEWIRQNAGKGRAA